MDLNDKSGRADSTPAVLPFHESVRMTLQNALATTQGNIPQAAKALEISRSTFYRMRKKYQLT